MMNPCPCGYLGDPLHPCRCTPDQVQRYRGRISGPLLDRIDMCVEVPRVSIADLSAARSPHDDDSVTVRQRVINAREKALLRAGQPNSALSVVNLERDCALPAAERDWLQEALDKLGTSARAYHRILRVARTIADLEGGTGCVEQGHLAEALNYRRF